MPARSQAQRRFLAARFGPDWMKEHHFANEGPLPERLHPKRKRPQKHQRVSYLHELNKARR